MTVVRLSEAEVEAIFHAGEKLAKRTRYGFEAIVWVFGNDLGQESTNALIPYPRVVLLEEDQDLVDTISFTKFEQDGVEMDEAGEAEVTVDLHLPPTQQDDGGHIATLYLSYREHELASIKGDDDVGLRLLWRRDA